MKRINFILLSIILSVSFIFCNKNTESDFTILKGPYLGQRPPGMTPEIFAPGIISTNMNAAKIVFSSDGKEIFFRLMNYNHSFITMMVSPIFL